MSRKERRRHRSWRFWGKVIILAIVSIPVVWTAALVYAYTDPYEPYHVYDYGFVPDTVCPFERVQVGVDRFYDDDANVTRIITDTGWQDADDPTAPIVSKQTAITDGAELEMLASGRRTVQSPILREVSNEPKEYRIVASYDVTRRIFMFYPTKRVTFASEQTVEVLPIQDDRCVVTGAALLEAEREREATR